MKQVKFLKLLIILGIIGINNSFYINSSEGSKYPKVKQFPKLPEYLEIEELKPLRDVLNARSISLNGQIAFLNLALAYKLSPEQRAKFGVEIPKGILLYGPPGTGKTVLARQLKEIIGGEFIELTPADLSTTEKIQEQFKKARELAAKTKKTVIVFLDEVDDIASPTSPVLNQLLTEMSSKNNNNLLLIAATNFKEKLAPSFMRSGRLDIDIYIPLPKGPSRLTYISENLPKIWETERINITENDLIDILKLTKGFNAADINNMTRQATIIALNKKKEAVGIDDFKEAIQNIKKKAPYKASLITRLRSKL